MKQFTREILTFDDISSIMDNIIGLLLNERKKC